MPLPGFPPSIPPGDHYDFLLDFDVADLGNGAEARVVMLAATGYGNMHWALIADHTLLSIVYLPEAITKRFAVYLPPFISAHAVSAAPLGEWDAIPPGVDVTIQQEFFITDKAQSIQYDFDAVISQRAYGTGSSQLSNWALTGLRRYTTGRPVEGEPTKLRLDVKLTNSGTTRTVELYNAGVLLASGSRTGNGTISLTAQNGSGLAGTVDVTYTGDIALGVVYFQARWPSQYKVYVDDVLTKTVSDPGLQNRISVQLGPLATGTRNIKVLAVSDTLRDGTLSAADPIAIPGRPLPPGVPSLAA